MTSVKNIGAQVKLRSERARSRYGWFDVLIQTFKRYSEDDGGFYAASLTYYAFFSIFPLLLFAISALGFITFLSEDFRQRLIEAGVNTLPLIRQVVKPRNLQTIEDARFTLAAAGLLLVLYSGSGGIVAFQHALNRIDRVTAEGTFVQKRLASFKFLGGIGLIVLLSVGVSSLALIDNPVIKVLAFFGGVALSVLMFSIAFRLLPQKVSLSWTEVVPGALAAAVAFEVLKVVGPLYLTSGDQGRNDTFAAFATAATLLVSAYVLCQITLLAAELNAVLAERRRSREFSLANKEVVP